MLRIADDYDRLAEWAEKNSISWWDKKDSASAIRRGGSRPISPSCPSFCVKIRTLRNGNKRKLGDVLHKLDELS